MKTLPSPHAKRTTKPATTLGRVLVIDDHREARQSMADLLRHAGYHVDPVDSGACGLQALAQESYDAIVTDLQMPGMTGLELLANLAQRPHGAQVIMVTAHASVSTAVEAMRRGAFDYLEKPFSAEQLEDVVRRALARGELLDHNQQATACPEHDVVMVGGSRAMTELRERIAQAAPTSETVLICGESGTGKELVARLVHQRSPRGSATLVSLNCPVLSAHLLESELFGHEKGAFTGADAPRTGRFELADGGTILLDEITEIDSPLQAKLLRVLQEKAFERVGSSVTRHVDVRVLATTNRDLLAEVDQGRFRRDLYYRLAVLPMTVPPLRQRREDIPDLIDHFARQTALRMGRQPIAPEPAALDLLVNYHWPGNVRELENIVTRASVLSGDAVRADVIRAWLIDPAGHEPATTDAGWQVGLSLQAMERKLIEATMARYGGHRAKTAEALGIGIRTLSGKLREYGYAPRTKEFANAN